MTVAVGASVAGAQTQDTSTDQSTTLQPKGPLTWEERVDEIKLVDEADYEAWKQYMIGNGRQMIADKVTSEDFAKMAELFDAIKAGDYDKAKVLGKDLKMPFGLGMGPGMNGNGRGPKGMILNSVKFQALSQDVQDKIKAAHEAGDRELVRQLMEENGLAPAVGKFKDRWGQQATDNQ